MDTKKLKKIHKIISKIKRFKREHKIISKIFYVLFVIIVWESFVPFLRQPFVSFFDSIINPPFYDIRLEVIKEPFLDGNNTYGIKFSIYNNGTKEINNPEIYYKIPCIMNTTKRIFLNERTFLNPNEFDYFEIITNKLNPNCSPYTKLITFQFYKDKNGQQYVKLNGDLGVVCMYCSIFVNISSDDLFRSYEFKFPYFEGTLNASLSISDISNYTGKDLYDYNSFENKSELEYMQGFDIGMMLADTSTICLKGDEQEFCNSFK
ncbi:MAG: hypothetical protein WC307_05305 [Candidatus Nanoarchaeia archaeon]|jgi:hypothetical protein